MHNMYSNLAGLLVHCHPENASATHYPEHQTVTRYLEYPKYGSFPRHQSAIHTGDRVTLHVCVSPCLYWLMTHNPPTGKRCIVLTAKSVCQHGMHTQQAQTDMSKQMVLPATSCSGTAGLPCNLLCLTVSPPNTGMRGCRHPHTCMPHTFLAHACMEAEMPNPLHSCRTL